MTHMSRELSRFPIEAFSPKKPAPALVKAVRVNRLSQKYHYRSESPVFMRLKRIELKSIIEEYAK